jgi:nucleotide-binding universal stress UspA family protein
MEYPAGFEPKRILCPIDFSEPSNLALKYAAIGSREYGAKLSILHAETFELPKYFLPAENDQLIQELAAARRKVRNYLARHVKEILGVSGGGLTLDYEVLETHPVEAILGLTEKQSIDLIVMGTHGSGGFKRLLLGSVTENVVRNSKVPVFAVRQKEHQFIDVTLAESIPRLERILCPVDITEEVGTGLRYAVSLAERFRSSLTVLYSVEPEQRQDPSQAQERLCSWISHRVRANCTLDPVVRQGRAAEQIIVHAREGNDDLIVLEARHQPFLEATFLGKTTELVLRHAPVPVLVTPRFPHP